MGFSTEPNWRVQFEDAFGISVEDFYVKFAQHQAAGFPPLESTDATCPPESSDGAALVALDHAMGGGSWKNNTNWLGDAPVCRWHGVYTDAGGRVTHLVLIGNGLSGTTPAEVGDLSNLEEPSLSGNQFTGCVPQALADVDRNDIDELGVEVCKDS